MPFPPIPDPDFTRTLPGVVAHVASLTTVLQGLFVELGRWTYHSARDLQLGTVTAGALLTATSASGHLAYLLIGNTAIISLDINAMSLSAATNELLIRLPDNLSFASRAAGPPAIRAVAPAAISDSVGVSVGFVQVRGSTVSMFHDVAGGNFAVGGIFFAAQLAFEYQRIGDKA